MKSNWKCGLGALFAVAIACSPANAQFGEQVEKASLHVETDRAVYGPGEAARLSALVTIEPGWHTNSHIPSFDYLIGTDLTLGLPDDWQEPTLTFPEGELKSFGFTDQPISVYEGDFAILADFVIPADSPSGSHTIDIELTYQACDDRSCLPPVTTTVTASFDIDESKPSNKGSSPSPLPPTASSDGTNLGWMLLLGVLGGLILNAMPCVLPVLSLKLFGLVKSAAEGRRQVVVGALATSLGILLSFWALALGAVVAKSAGGAVGWGVQFQEPVFVVVLAIIVVLFCLNLWGVFEIGLPTNLARVANSGPKEGISGHLATGLFATLMATPCSAPFLGSAVGFAFTQKAGTIFAVFTSVAIGMALPYLALAIFPGATSLLPKPGPWMNHLRVVLGFLLAGAAVWLFYVLAAQMSRERVAFVELGMLALALFVWLRHRVAHSSSGRRLALVGALASAVIIVGIATRANGANGTLSSQESSSLISWVAFDRSEAESQARNGSLVFVDVTADWCFTCKVNERLVLETDAIAELFARFEVIPMKADWTNRSDKITQFLSDHGRYGIPFYLLYRPGKDPFVFGELLTTDKVIQVVEDAGARVDS